MTSRPRAGRGTTGRDGGKDVDFEADLLARVIDGLRKAKESQEQSERLGRDIVALEEEIKLQGKPTLEQHVRLDQLYREKLRHAEGEKKALDDYDVVNNLAMIAAMKASDEPTPRNGTVGKPRKQTRPPTESEAIADSPGPSPSDTRIDMLKRAKGAGQRSSSVGSRSGAPVKPEEAVEMNRGVLAEREGKLIIGTEVFYKFPKGSPDDLGAGIQCIIKKVWLDKKPIGYDVQDPEPDTNGKQNVHKAIARDLIPIPQAGALLPTFPNGATVFARYPETDTFYKAKVRGFQKGLYTLKFEGEEDDKELPVDKRFVLDARWR